LCSFSPVNPIFLDAASRISKKNLNLCCVGWEKRFPGDPRFKVPEALKKLVKEGKLGTKSGAGFYDYSKK